MVDPSGFGLKLASVSEALAGLADEHVHEMAGFGLLVDWELVKFCGRQGWELVSLSFRWKEEEVLLVLKVRIEEALYVGFVSRDSPISCVRTLVRKTRASSLALYPDKYS